VKLVSPLLKRVVYPTLAQMGYLRRCTRGQLCVVTYHGVRPAGYRELDPDLDGSLVRGAAFRSQIRLLKSHYNVVAPDQFLQWVQGKAGLPARALLLTCDDGLKNVLTEMLPVLRDEGVSCLFFITGASAGDADQMLWYEELYLMLLRAPAGLMEVEELGVRASLGAREERRKTWLEMVKALSRTDSGLRSTVMERVRKQCGLAEDWRKAYWDDAVARRRFGLLNADEVKALVASGMAVGAHTVSHPVLPQAPDEVAWSEIAASRGMLEDAFGAQVWALAYPFGDPASVSEREMDMAKKAGFECAFVNHSGGFGADLPMFALPRVHVTADMTLGEFEAHVSGFHRTLRRLGQEDTTSVAQS